MAAAHLDEKRLELKVGTVILAALVVLVGFLILVSDIQFGKKREFSVYFQNPGSLSPGVAVKIAGRKVGKVTELSFVGRNGPLNPVTKRHSLVRVRVQISEAAFSSLSDDAHFYITTQGVLGDPFLEIDPGISGNSVDSETHLFGTDPPRLDLFLADAAELVRGLNRLLVTNADSLDQLIRGSANLVSAVDALLLSDDGSDGARDRFSRILVNVEQLTLDFQVLVRNVNEKYMDNPALDATIRNMRSITARLDRDLDPLMTDIRSTMQVLQRVGDTIGPDEQKAIRELLVRLGEIVQRVDGTLHRVDQVVRQVEKGEGTIGQLMSDEQVYDDLKELVRDLKRHPWKLIWQE